ncbi:cubilin-like isoform X3 [Rhopilema esculentum]|uniref:cubilin-like isoform X3 n=1 Tax=Rhopilema esculentum TaxID=499914 RepID=UPI0031DE26C3
MFSDSQKMNLSLVLLWHVLSIWFENASGVCYGSTNNATTSLQTLAMTNYSNNEYCVFYIQPSSSYSSSSYYLEIEWKSFDIEGKLPSCKDYVEVFLTSSYGSIGRYCSDNMIDTTPFNMYSHDGYAKIVFKSDSATTRSGFSLTYQLKSKSGSPMGGYPSSTCYHSDNSAAATFFNSGWPNGYYSSDSPCLRDYFADTNAMRIAVMDLSLYGGSSFYCDTRDSYFQVIALPRPITSLSQASTVNGRLCGTKTPTVYTAENNYVYLYFNRPQNSTGYRGIMAGYLAYTEEDLNECTRETHNCNANAYCTNTVGSYRCTCRGGYTGNGYICNTIDVDECTLGTHSCSFDAYCTNTVGSYRCRCNSGYTGNGYFCNVIDYESSSSASNTGLYIGGAIGGVCLILVIIIPIICFCKRSRCSGRTSPSTQANPSHAAASAKFIAVKASGNDTPKKNTESLEQNVTQPAVIFSQG